jgi:hypothetical protein
LSQHSCYFKGVEMTRRGRKRRLVLEDEYWKLTLDGVPTVEACRQIASAARPDIGGRPKRAGCRRAGWLRRRSSRFRTTEHRTGHKMGYDHRFSLSISF